jgi:hypothetical protein
MGTIIEFFFRDDLDFIDFGEEIFVGETFFSDGTRVIGSTEAVVTAGIIPFAGIGLKSSCDLQCTSRS